MSSVLTLAMMQWSDMNAEDFINLRRVGAPEPRRPGTPTSESSGISSLTLSSAERDSGSRRASSVSSSDLRSESPRASTPNVDDSKLSACTNSKDTDSESEDVQINYLGRDILNLTTHLRQNLWHTQKPLITPVMPDCYKRNHAVFRSSPRYKQRMEIPCFYCGFPTNTVIV